MMVTPEQHLRVPPQIINGRLNAVLMAALPPLVLHLQRATSHPSLRVKDASAHPSLQRSLHPVFVSFPQICPSTHTRPVSSCLSVSALTRVFSYTPCWLQCSDLTAIRVPYNAFPLFPSVSAAVLLLWFSIHEFPDKQHWRNPISLLSAL